VKLLLRARAEEEFHVDRVVPMYRRLYEEIIARRAGVPAG
jgi:hypothetical protein